MTIASAEQALRGVEAQIREATTPVNARAEARARHSRAVATGREGKCHLARTALLAT